MNFDDALDQIGAITRGITSRDHQGSPARVLTAEQTYTASAPDVWDALTNPERIPRWFMPVEGDLSVGGHYQLVGNAGGTIERCEPPRELAVTWEYGPEVSWLEVDLTEADGLTTLVLRHIAHVDDERWTEYGPGAVGVGWDLALLGLRAHLAGATDVDPVEAEAWTLSDEGRAFIAQVSDAWGEASIAGGTDAGQARAAAGRTTAFYTGQPVAEA